MTQLERLAQERTHDVVSTTISLTIEKIASEIARELLQDPGFKQELRGLARRSFGRTVKQLRRSPRGTRSAIRERKRRSKE
jgi:hypothetical protein